MHAVFLMALVVLMLMLHSFVNYSTLDSRAQCSQLSIVGVLRPQIPLERRRTCHWRGDTSEGNLRLAPAPTTWDPKTATPTRVPG